MTHTVIGLFDSRAEAQAAMNDLVAGGFMRENIDLSNRSQNAGASGGGDASASSGFNTDTSNDSIGDKVSNFFGSLFGDDSPETRNYTAAAGGTEAILSVQTESQERAEQAAEILDRNGAVDVDERAARFQGQGDTQTSTSAQGFNNTQTSATSQGFNADTQTRTGAESDTRIPVMEEELQVGKREVDRGGVRIRSRIVERPVEERIRLREEHVVVNRTPVDRAVTEGDFDTFREGDIEITEHSEEAVVSKQARVTEEISVGKNVQEREEVVSDTVRKTEVDVDEIDNDTRSRGANR